MSIIRLLHISDIHLTDHGEPIWGVNTMEHFHRLMNSVKQHSDVNAIIVSGDISNDGSIWSYKYADGMFKELGIPTYWCIGNHDRPDSLQGSISFCEYLSEVNILDWGFIMLNSVIPDEINPDKNKARGFVSEEQLDLIRNASARYENLAIVLHHPPIETGGWLDRRILENRTALVETIRELNNVKLVMYGHIHCSTQIKQDGVVYASAPAVSYAFNNSLAKFEIDYGAEGYNIIEIENGTISIMHYLLNS